jgi:hypothetical protein
MFSFLIKLTNSSLLNSKYGVCPHANSSPNKIANDQTSDLFEYFWLNNDYGDIHLNGTFLLEFNV